MASVPPTATCRRPALVVEARRLLAVTAVDEQNDERRRPVPGNDRRMADDSDHDILQTGVVDRRPERRQRVHPAGARVDDASDRGAPNRPGSPRCHGGDRRRTARCRPPAPRRRATRSNGRSTNRSRPSGRRMRRPASTAASYERVAFVGRHEPFGGQGPSAQRRAEGCRRHAGHHNRQCVGRRDQLHLRRRGHPADTRSDVGDARRTGPGGGAGVDRHSTRSAAVARLDHVPVASPITCAPGTG